MQSGRSGAVWEVLCSLGGLVQCGRSSAVWEV